MNDKPSIADQPPAASGAARKPRHGLARQGVEFLVCLGIAVSLCKAFAAESYRIETGSMAPYLYGWHRDVDCPSCGWHFAVGVAQDDGDVEATCPNCGHGPIVAAALENGSTHSLNASGDRVLVHKDSYANRPPRRWEIAVFHYPQKPSENYVKRIVGLPGETLQIRDGDLWIDGQIQRKPLDLQRRMRIPVFDNGAQPPESDLNWRPRWQPERADSHWRRDGDAFAFDAPSDENESGDETDWIVYEHWIRDGSLRTTSVPLSTWPEGATLPDPFLSNVNYDAPNRLLACRGVMSSSTRRQLEELSPDIAFQQAIEQLYVKSHIAPITDRYGYNTTSQQVPVRDLMVSLRIVPENDRGEFTIRMTDGREIADCRIDFDEKLIDIYSSRDTEPVIHAALPPTGDEGFLLEMSLFDRQCTVAVDHVVVGEAWTYSDDDETMPPAPLRPVRFGAAGDAKLRVDEIQLFRDVQYLCKSTEAGFVPYALGEDEYFALGDNSPISEDSRIWLALPGAAKLTSRHFIGKPFLVHLPSKVWRSSISIPDFSRMRYIR